MDYRQEIAQSLHSILQEDLSLDQIYQILERPKTSDHGDLAFPTFQLAKTWKKAPQAIAQEIGEDFQSDLVEKVEVVGPYLNFFLKRDLVSKDYIERILAGADNFGQQDLGQGRKVPIDMSSPNIAKPMSMGHLRSTVIGNALANIYEKLGFEPVKINYLGDWGTQFGKLIAAIKLWGDEEVIQANPIQELNRLYVHFHEEADKDDSLNDLGRQWFKKLEDGDQEALRLWEFIREESLKEFQTVYDRLEVSFDSYNGESFYNDKMQPIVDELAEKDLMFEDEGAMIVDLEDYNLSPALIMKQDGATLYITRDLAAANWRKAEYDFDEALYVVGQDQALHFKQLKAVLNEMGRDWADDIQHIPFGLITVNGEKMSTRSGRVVLLNDVLDEAVAQASKQIEEKNPDLADKDQVSEAVGVGAVVFHDLKNDRTNNFDFDLEEIVQFEGETGPYVQYTRARALSILRKAGMDPADLASVDDFALTDDYSWEIIKLFMTYEDVLKRAYENKEPSLVAKHALELAQAFNKFYAHIRVLDDSPEKPARLALVQAVALVLKEDLRLLSVQAPDEM